MGTPTAGRDRPVDTRRVAKARQRGLSADDAGRLADLLALLGDSVRVRMLYALELVDELCVSDMALALDITEDASSYGLRMLRMSGLVQTRKDGRVVHYRLADTFPEPLLEHCLLELLHLSRLAHRRDARPKVAAAARRSR
jgi:ArsR family transcriptional regulator, lead/cadmium/zinc/bismuth-responsive transcriptional repressor